MNLWDRQPVSDVLSGALKNYIPHGREVALREAHRGTRENQGDYALLRGKAERDPLRAGPRILRVLGDIYEQFETGGYELHALSNSVRLRAEGLIPDVGEEGVAQGIVHHWRERAALVGGAEADEREEAVAADVSALRRLRKGAPELFQRVLQETPYASQVLAAGKEGRRDVPILPV